MRISDWSSDVCSSDLASALPAPSAILFDWDNTLVDSWAVIHHAMTVTFETLGERPWTLEETRRNVRQSARDAFPALFGARADQATAVFYRTYEAAHLARLQPSWEEGRVGKRWVGTGRSRWAPDH